MNKVLVISGAVFAFCMLVMNVIVWVNVVGAATQQTPDAEVAPPIVPVSQKTGPKDEQASSTADGETEPVDRARFGMPVEEHLELQERFEEGVKASRRG